jgi:hypothetical protein
VQLLAWSRNNRHLVSLDSAFRVCVWDRRAGVRVAAFAGPPGDLYAENAAVAISDDGGLAAYASGGDTRAEAVLWDVRAGKALGRWPLPAGFERMVCTGKGRFLLVREEKQVRPQDAGNRAAWPVQSVAYELTAGSGLRKLGVIRASEASDVRRFLSSGLTPDGRLFWWVGPRKPASARRVEVRAVATGKLLRRLPRPFPATNDSEPSVCLSPDGKQLWVGTLAGYSLHDLSGGRPPQPSRGPPGRMVPGRWAVVHWYARGQRPALHLRPWGAERAWLALGNDDLSGPGPPAFSHDGRSLAWGAVDGTVTVADLDALRRAVRAAEESAGGN